MFVLLVFFGLVVEGVAGSCSLLPLLGCDDSSAFEVLEGLDEFGLAAAAGVGEVVLAQGGEDFAVEARAAAQGVQGEEGLPPVWLTSSSASVCSSGEDGCHAEAVSGGVPS